MSIKSGFFNYELIEAAPDRTYSAEDWATLFGILYSSGVFSKYLNKLEFIQKTPAGLNVLVKSGAALANGYWLINDSDLQITIESPHATLARIYAIIVKFDIATARVGSIIYRKGTADTVPVAPPLVNTASVFELCLAYVAVAVGASSIVAANITDKRNDSTVCGYSKTMSDQQLDDMVALYDVNFADVMEIFEVSGKIKPERLSSEIVAITNSKTLVLEDAGKELSCNKTTAMNIVVPLNSDVAFPVGTEIEIYQANTGVVTVSKVSGVTFEIKNKTSPSNAVIDARYGYIGLKKKATNLWSLRGDISGADEGTGAGAVEVILLPLEDTADWSGDPDYPANMANNEVVVTVAEEITSDPDAKRTFIKFNVSSIPAGATIMLASLMLYKSAVGENHVSLPDSTMEFSIHRVTESWSGNTLIYLNSPAFTVERYGEIYTAGYKQTWSELDITLMVQEWIQGTYPNYGLCAKSINEGTKYIIWASREHSTPAYRPYLKITYIL